MTMKVLVGGAIHEDGLALLRDAGGVEFESCEDSLVPSLYTADALLVRTQKVTAEMIEKATQLKIVSRHGIGYDAIAVNALNARGIPLALVGGVSTHAVAEHTLALMLAAARRLGEAGRRLRAGDWASRGRFHMTELRGKTLLVIGFGRIGREVARRAIAFGMNVVAFDPHLAEPPDDAPEGVRRAEHLADGLAAADFISLHLPGGGAPILGAAEFAQLGKPVVVVNTARGDVIDEAALVAALNDGRVAAAGLDVFAQEPPAPDNPLLAMEQVILTPHVASLTTENTRRMGMVSARNILDFFAGKLDRSLVVNADDIGFTGGGS
ncbi:MAG: hydroxyacid dehydrogenase [Alphaproteobacteria bacterium]|nr:hydroxyacid dehydrogenase [Alphaproteobacteria bacterium]MDA8003960.1 hydroxyacid dehydrogenase [Alphaproteobacteria bacterium]MDA8006295.1 hydroxyacid dehydrogenase [Alphaproteobacteria bacterium]MDA8012989.1 hydroxyacid dehydrogenase [Alphaproteobacteria bacterium]